MAEKGLYFGSLMLAPLLQAQQYETAATITKISGNVLATDGIGLNGFQANYDYVQRLLSSTT